VIAKALRGYRPSGLIRYLFGPGKFEEHRNPRVVASWDGAPWLHQPAKLPSVKVEDEILPPGEFDFDLKALTTTMQELAEDAGLPVTNPPKITPAWAARVRNGDVPADAPWWVKYYRYAPKEDAVVLRRGYVWHCPVRLHDRDPKLTDKQWEYIAERLMKVRHADDHIHLMATLVSETTGRRFYPDNDWPKLRAECERLEAELGLYSTAAADRTATITPTRAEQAKAARAGKPRTPREQLQRIVARCAGAVRTPEQFLAELDREGLIVKTSRHADGRIRGYSVALPGDLNADGAPVRFGGGSLARDLSWPKLLERWASTPPPEPVPAGIDGRVEPGGRREVLEQVTALVDRASAAVRDGTENTDGIVHATGEVLASLAGAREGHDPGPLTEIAVVFDRAARIPHRVLPSLLGPLARDLRQASRRIGAAGALSGRGHERFAMLALVLALAGLVAAIARWQQFNERPHQAAAARRAAGALPLAAAPGGSRPGPRPGQPPAAGGTRRDRHPARRELQPRRSRPRGPA
jgi:hypothetical protein